MLLKHSSGRDLLKRLPDILSLLQELKHKETGLQFIETILRYLFNTMNEVSAETIKEIAERAISAKAGEYIMTLAEKLREEGEIKGKIEGKIEGLSDAIELGMTLKFPDDVNIVMAKVQEIKDIKSLTKIKDAIKTASNVSEIMLLIK